jgi:monomeric isocitrate dehydrogenase
MSGLWRDKPATPNQQRLAFGSHRGKVTQADVLLEMLRKARETGKAVELPDILHAGIAQFTARIFELRERGFQIDNEMEHVNGQRRSRYWLRYDPEQDGAR